MKYLSNIDLNNNELQNAIIQNLATDPDSNLEAGRFWFNTTSNLFKFYDGTNIRTFESYEDLLVTLTNYQSKITASGILKGNGSGTVTAATAGTDYGYIELTGTSDPTTSTVGAVGQHYLNTTSGVEFVCTKVSGSTRTWTRVTVDISGKQDVIDANNKLSVNYVDGLASVATSGSYNDLSDTPTIPVPSNDNPLMNGTVKPGTSADYSRKDHVHPVDTSRQAKITASGILKGNGSGTVSAAVADTDYQSVITLTANRALVSNGSGKVAVSSVTSTELSYLSGVTSGIQGQLDNIPKYNYKDAVICTVNDNATQAEINTAAVTAISNQYSSPAKWDAVVVEIKFTPSDIFKNGIYYYNGTAWTFLYYVTTGIQLANGTTAGLIQEADSNSDITLASGVGTVNKATQLRTSRNITVQGTYGTSSTDGITATAASFNGTANATIKISAIKTELLSGQVPVNKGGTGKSTIGANKILKGTSSGNAYEEIGIDTTVTSNSTNLVTSGAVATAIGGGNVAHKYTTTNPALTASGGTASWTVTHNLNTRSVIVDIMESATYNKVIADVSMTTVNTVTIKFISSSNITAGTYAVTVIG